MISQENHITPLVEDIFNPLRETGLFEESIQNLIPILKNYGYSIAHISLFLKTMGKVHGNLSEKDQLLWTEKILKNTKGISNEPNGDIESTIDEFIIFLEENHINDGIREDLENILHKYVPAKQYSLEFKGLEERLKEELSKGRVNLPKLTEYLRLKYNIFKDEKTGEVFIEKPNGGYIEATIPQLHMILSVLCEDVINTDHIEKIIKHLSIYEKPELNIIQFQNCYLDLESMDEIPLSEFYYCQKRIPWNYNKYQKSPTLEKALKETLKEDYPIFLKMVGYFFTSHHNDEKIFFLIGLPGSMKGTIANILEKIFTLKKIGNSSLQNIAAEDFIGANIMDKHVNISYDTSYREIPDISALKSIASGEPRTFNPKYAKTINAEGYNLPKILILGNGLPSIQDDDAIYERIIIIRTHKKYRHTEDQIPKFTEVLDYRDYEWLIQASIEAYKETSWPDYSEDLRLEYLKESNPYMIAIKNLYDFNFELDPGLELDPIYEDEVQIRIRNEVRKMHSNNFILRVPKVTKKAINEMMEENGAYRIRTSKMIDDDPNGATERVFAFKGVKKLYDDT